MMQIVYFSRKSQFLAEIETFPGEKKFIAPSPLKADGLRSQLINHTNSDVVTIAQFTAEIIKGLWGSTDKLPVKRKSELLLIFGILKEKHLPDLGYEQFTQAYNLFSDLRSFSLNKEALSTVLDEQSPIVKAAFDLFWLLLDATGYLDEHGAYQKISEELRSVEEKKELKKTYIFWGFQHLNGQQVDFLKALSIRYNVIIPFPLDLKDKIKKTDWLNWLRDSKTAEKDFDLIPSASKALWKKINSREISLNLKEIVKSGDQILLGVSKLSALHLDIVPSKEVSFKISHQLVFAEIAKLCYELKSAEKKINSLKSLETLLGEKRQRILEKIKSEPVFKMLKAIELYSAAIAQIRELSDEEIEVNEFFLKLLNDVVTLNQPRISFVPMTTHDLSIEMKDMSSIEDISRDRRVILCIDDRFEEILGLGQTYTETIQKSLSSLGPLKRSELELLFKQWELQDLFSHGEVIVLMSESTLKHSLVWKRLFSQTQLIEDTTIVEQSKRSHVDHISGAEVISYSGSFSATKLQTFVDCPRKFYFNYIDKIFPRVSLRNDFDPMTSGTISHKIIEVFFENKHQEPEIPSITKKIMEEVMMNEGVSLTQDKMLRHQLIFNQRSLNGVTFLKRIEELLGLNIDWSIEKSFSINADFEMNGKIDCIGSFDNTIFLLDFKSTKFAASSNKEVEEFESLQLWAYAKAASEMVKNFEHRSIVMGFISLDNPSESNLLFSDNELLEKFKSSKMCRTYMFKKPFPEIFLEANQKMKKVTEDILGSKVFLAAPRKNETCRLCELNKVCLKSEIALE